MAHSYGGAPVTEGVAEAPNVRHLVYLAAFMLDEGESLLGAAGGTPPPFWGSTADRQAWRALNPEGVFYNDCPPTDTAWAVSQLQPQSASSFTERLGAAAWRDGPSAYVVCERDQAIPLIAQEAMSNAPRTWFDSTLWTFAFLSRPNELVALLKRFA